MARVRYDIDENPVRRLYVNPRAVNAIEAVGEDRTKLHVAGVPYPYVVRGAANDIDEELEDAERRDRYDR